MTILVQRRGLLGMALSLFTSGGVLRGSNKRNDMFPEGFVWGASTSSYQIEGAVEEDGRGQSIWDVFSHKPGRVQNGDTGDVACDHYHRWREDIDLLSDGGFTAYRFSTAWSRILGLRPWLCLYHWDLPQVLQEEGGWLNRDTCTKFAEYARVMAKRVGDRVKDWLTFNEPNVHALFGHGTGSHAPGLDGLPNTLAAMHHLNLAHGRAVQALRAERAGLRLGSVISLQPVRPSSDTTSDSNAAERFDAMWNGACLDPLVKGIYPAPVAGDFAPLVADGDFATMRQPIDFLGVNYYSPMYVMGAPQTLFGAWFGAAPIGMRFTAMGWPVDAGALTEELIRLRDRYGNLELYVTENGACYDDKLLASDVVVDNDRIAYLRDHLAAVLDALAAGVNLHGYFVWSLLDNFEWAQGYSRRFGIVYVDFRTLKRTPKASYHWLAEVIKSQTRRN
jgi:beta-glucosidase